MKKNLNMREIVLFVLFLDTRLMYVMNFIFGFANGMSIMHIKDYFGVLFRILFVYICMFFLWSPVRYEEYDEKNPESFLLDWTFIVIIEYILFVVFSCQGKYNIVLFVDFVCTIIYIIIRFLINSIKLETKEMIDQLKKDLPTSILLIGFFFITNILLVLSNNQTKFATSIITISSSLIISIIYVFYWVQTIKDVLNINLEIKIIMGQFLCVIAIHFCLLFGICLQRYLGLEERLHMKLLLVLLLVLANLIYICKLNELVDVINKKLNTEPLQN